MTNTNHSPIRKHHTPNIRYKNKNNKQIHQSADTFTNYNDNPSDKTTNCRYSIKKQKSVPLSKTHVNTKTQ